MGRKDFDPDEMEPRAFYRLLTAVILPRPIAWVSSRSADGVDNLALHSVYPCSRVYPPVLHFTSVGRMDSLTNIEQTGEFVVNFSPEHMFEQINATATDFPPEVSEFEAVGVASERSARVAPLRVAGSPVAFECKLTHTHSFGDSTVVFGRVVHAAVDESVLEGERGLPHVELLRPMARLGKIEWARLGEVEEITRIPHEEWPGHYDPGEEEESS
ncbi:MAG TPA: flavin reductase family protein [Solirubrobacterales bacterium]|nr:flavin reductase family protein [Solirubrobacterales bacterium]